MRTREPPPFWLKRLTIFAFIEYLKCGHHLVVRAGPKATAFGMPWKKSCLGEIDGDSVTLMAFCEPWLVQFLRRWFPRIVGSLTPYVKASMRALYAEGFKKVHLDRLTANPRRLVFTQGDEEGKFTMKALHENHGSKDAHGKLKTDKETVTTIGKLYMDKIASGEVTIEADSSIEKDLGGGRFFRAFIADESKIKA